MFKIKSENDRGKENHAEEENYALPPVKNDPAYVEGHRQGHKANAQHEEKHDLFSAAGDSHSGFSRLYSGRGADSRREILEGSELQDECPNIRPGARNPKKTYLDRDQFLFGWVSSGILVGGGFVALALRWELDAVDIPR